MGRPVSQQRWAGAGGVPGVGADDVTAMLEGGGGVVWDGPDDTALCKQYIACVKQLSVSFRVKREAFRKSALTK